MRSGYLYTFPLGFLCFVLAIMVRNRNAEIAQLESSLRDESSIVDMCTQKSKEALRNKDVAINAYKKNLQEQLEAVKGEMEKQKEDFQSRQELETINHYGHNAYKSSLLSLSRDVPDTRPSICKHTAYPGSHIFPKASIIIPFYNEHPSILLRTATSLINRGGKDLIEEVLLVDDSSDHLELGKQLEAEIKKLWPDGLVKVIRTTKRQGIIRTRLQGAEAAKGSILVFIDGHCEANENWLQPLIYPIVQDHRTITLPAIDSIDPISLVYANQRSDVPGVGGFLWNLDYTWELPRNLPKDRKLSDPIKSPTMAGGLFAVSRQYFFHIGTYDEQMDGWGGENVEISFRIWQCGGKMLTIPCSHIGHIYRDFHPYKFSEGSVGETYFKNSARLAEVWMDDYKKYFYESYNTIENPSLVLGPLDERRKLRIRLECKPFRWFLENIIPHQFIPSPENMQYKGILRNGASHCLDMMNRKVGQRVGVYNFCHGLGNQQTWILTTTNELRSMKDYCLDVSNANVPVTVSMFPCHGMQGNQAWKYNPTTGQFIHEATKLCLEDVKGNGMANTCNPKEKQQVWAWVSKEQVQ